MNRKRTRALAMLLFATVALGAGLLLAGDVPDAPAAPTAIPGITPDNFPRINGGPAKRPLINLLAIRALGVPAALGRYADYGQLTAYFPVRCDPEQIQKAYQLIYRSGRVRADGAHLAYLTLIEGTSDLIIVPNKPSDEEEAAARARNVAFDMHPIGLDGLVFLVNQQNPVASLTLDQIRDVFTGKISNWHALGGKDDPIKAFIRDPNSGSQELFENLVYHGKADIKIEGDMLLSIDGPVDRVAKTPNAIAYSLFYYERYMNRHPYNRLLAVNGVLPTSETIADRKYPLASEVWMVTRKGIPQDSPTAKLRDWILSDAGQRVLMDSGYVPIRRLPDSK